MGRCATTAWPIFVSECSCDPGFRCIKIHQLDDSASSDTRKLLVIRIKRLWENTLAPYLSEDLMRYWVRYSALRMEADGNEAA